MQRKEGRGKGRSARLPLSGPSAKAAVWGTQYGSATNRHEREHKNKPPKANPSESGIGRPAQCHKTPGREAMAKRSTGADSPW